MNLVDDPSAAIQKILGPYIRPREEVAQIRRILALHLDSCLKEASVTAPLALVESSEVKLSTARGLHREYLEALSANRKARDQHDAYCQDANRPGHEPASSSIAPAPGHNQLQAHLETLSLHKRQEKLQVIEKHLGQLRQKPAAAQDFLDPNEIFKHSRSLPEIPNEIVNAISLDQTASSTQLEELLDQLEKHVLQAKMILKREEQLLEQVKSRSSARAENISGSAKFEALNTTRNELISWIETELGKASGEGPSEDDQRGQHNRGLADQTRRMDEQLASIKWKYAKYLEARKALLQLASQQATPDIKPPPANPKLQAAPTVPPPAAPFTHLLSPYLKELLALAREQKGLITQKPHLNTAISKQLKENCQGLDHLAEESQLIPRHPMPGASRRKQTFGDTVSGSEGLDPLSRVKPWVFAADSAKISTLEAVAEKIEEGQIALESSMRTIGEIDQLLGRKPPPPDGLEQAGQALKDDIWLTEGQPAGKAAMLRKHADRKGSVTRPSEDVWDMLDGKLGLLRADDDQI
ncbi:hypothetical protein B0T22DRAFT_53048 [Podospora appendiculata]|uniref:Uncharacterized protein n=1 Tax=Podospora appendiculata TaxID=314037 RepID=A0AAE1CGM4_9PEZI|nr:hypothetical protein B0T22DRAFT_53048 [Podospora appendiculata]